MEEYLPIFSLGIIKGAILSTNMIIIVNGLRVFVELCLSEALQETNAVILAELRK